MDDRRRGGRQRNSIEKFGSIHRTQQPAERLLISRSDSSAWILINIAESGADFFELLYFSRDAGNSLYIFFFSSLILFVE